MQIVKDGVEYNLTTTDVAEMLGYHVDHVRRITRNKQVPAIKRGREYLYNKDQVLNALVESGSESEETPVVAETTDMRESLNEVHYDDEDILIDGI